MKNFLFLCFSSLLGYNILQYPEKATLNSLWLDAISSVQTLRVSWVWKSRICVVARESQLRKAVYHLHRFLQMLASSEA